MDPSTRSKIFQKLGFWEVDLKKISLSCGKCNKAVKASECGIKTEEIKSKTFTWRLQLLCNICGSVVAGADA